MGSELFELLKGYSIEELIDYISNYREEVFLPTFLYRDDIIDRFDISPEKYKMLRHYVNEEALDIEVYNNLEAALEQLEKVEETNKR